MLSLLWVVYAKLSEMCSDDGVGMDPEGIRKCMSLGYSSKTSNNTIGQCELIIILGCDVYDPLQWSWHIFAHL